MKLILKVIISTIAFYIVLHTLYPTGETAFFSGIVPFVVGEMLFTISLPLLICIIIYILDKKGLSTYSLNRWLWISWYVIHSLLFFANVLIYGV